MIMSIICLSVCRVSHCRPMACRWQGADPRAAATGRTGLPVTTLWAIHGAIGSYITCLVHLTRKSAIFGQHEQPWDTTPLRLHATLPSRAHTLQSPRNTNSMPCRKRLASRCGHVLTRSMCLLHICRPCSHCRALTADHPASASDVTTPRRRRRCRRRRCWAGPAPTRTRPTCGYI